MFPSSNERIFGTNPMRRDRAVQSQQTAQPKRNKQYSRSMTIVKQTIAKRRVMKWLPVLCENDLVHGSWWLVWGSVLAILIPVVPLINLYLPSSHQFWPVPYKNLIALPDHTAVYAVLIGCGLFFLLGSILLVRFFANPRPKPIFPCMFCQTDAVLSSWCFFLGIVPTIPLCVLYLHYLPNQQWMYGAAILVCAVASFAMLLFTLVTYPHPQGKPWKDMLVPMLHCLCCPVGSCCHVHFQSDWLLLCWLFMLGSWLTAGACAAALGWYIYQSIAQEIYNYATATADLIIVAIGSMYFVAGSYKSEDEEEDDEEGESSDDDSKEEDEEEEEDDDDDDEEEAKGGRERNRGRTKNAMHQTTTTNNRNNQKNTINNTNNNSDSDSDSNSDTSAMEKGSGATTPSAASAAIAEAHRQHAALHARNYPQSNPSQNYQSKLGGGSALSAYRAKRDLQRNSSSANSSQKEESISSQTSQSNTSQTSQSNIFARGLGVKGVNKGVLWRDPIRSPVDTPPSSPTSPTSPTTRTINDATTTITAAAKKSTTATKVQGKGQGKRQGKVEAQKQGLSKKKKMEEEEEEQEEEEQEEEEEDDEWQPDPRRRPSDQVVSRIAAVATNALHEENKDHALSFATKNKKKNTDTSGDFFQPPVFPQPRPVPQSSRRPDQQETSSSLSPASPPSSASPPLQARASFRPIQPFASVGLPPLPPPTLPPPAPWNTSAFSNPPPALLQPSQSQSGSDAGASGVPPVNPFTSDFIVLGTIHRTTPTSGQGLGPGPGLGQGTEAGYSLPSSHGYNSNTINPSSSSSGSYYGGREASRSPSPLGINSVSTISTYRSSTATAGGGGGTGGGARVMIPNPFLSSSPLPPMPPPTSSSSSAVAAEIASLASSSSTATTGGTHTHTTHGTTATSRTRSHRLGPKPPNPFAND